jgi:hypothetical protein
MNRLASAFGREAARRNPLITFDLVERHHGIQLICHAIRHLLDHPLDENDPGDVQAIDILQFAINPSETTPPSSYKANQQLAEASSCRVAQAGEAIVQHPPSDLVDLRNDVPGDIVRDQSPQLITRQHPVSLQSLFELLLHAVHYKVLGHSRAAGRESPFGSAR